LGGDSSSVRRCGLSTASSTSGIRPSFPSSREFIAARPHATEKAAADDPLDDGAGVARALVPDGCHLGDVSVVLHPDLERGVVEVVRRSASESRRNRLEDEAIDADAVASSSEWQPVEVDGRTVRRRRLGTKRRRVRGAAMATPGDRVRGMRRRPDTAPGTLTSVAAISPGGR